MNFQKYRNNRDRSRQLFDTPFDTSHHFSLHKWKVCFSKCMKSDRIMKVGITQMHLFEKLRSAFLSCLYEIRWNANCLLSHYLIFFLQTHKHQFYLISKVCSLKALKILCSCSLSEEIKGRFPHLINSLQLLASLMFSNQWCECLPKFNAIFLLELTYNFQVPSMHENIFVLEYLQSLWLQSIHLLKCDIPICHHKSQDFLTFELKLRIRHTKIENRQIGPN